MDKREFAALAAAMEEYYGRNQITKSAASMDIWYELIGDIPYGQCKNAVRQLMATNNFFPSAAEIRKLCTQTGDPEVPSIDDAWGMVLKAVRAYGYMQEAEALESLPEPCRSVVKNIGWQNICRSENIMAERAFFRDSYGPKLQEMKRVGMLPPGSWRVLCKDHGQGPDHSQESLYEEHLTCELLLVHDEQRTAGQHEAVQGRR